MSEKLQHTAASMREKMLNRYGDDNPHKHNKNHQLYRQHCRSHPINFLLQTKNELSENESTGILRATKLRKIRKRLNKGQVH